MQASRPNPTPGISLAGATTGQVLAFNGQVFAPADATGEDGGTIVNGDLVTLALPEGATKAAWTFVSIGTRESDPVYIQEGFINAWKTEEMPDADGELILHGSTRPDWAGEPEVTGDGNDIDLRLSPPTATWRTTIRLLGSAP